jgi:hypothetical protein
MTPSNEVKAAFEGVELFLLNLIRAMWFHRD